eukprot:TRINITY_DN14836_c0_g1_i1.p1 TRINITY_DN14836_c0_g1~~TRINITY_DN14836_c0_g1_i1.p1  ORF type:complete len:1110 (-),score=238.68 TRINITY_DN14836_c0_g1_i1:463-3792(-)
MALLLQYGSNTSAGLGRTTAFMKASRENALLAAKFPRASLESSISQRMNGLKQLSNLKKGCKRPYNTVSVLRTQNLSRTVFSANCMFIMKQNQRTEVTMTSKASKDSASSQDNNKYKHTVDLPKTKFSLRANSVTREPEIQKLWEEKQVWRRLLSSNNGGYFTLHDGPPYANGNLHIGHALNKILKDFINRYKLLQNYKVKFVPGWDCHGLPIELKVLQSLDPELRNELAPLKLRKKAAAFAMKTIDIQRSSFKRYGVWGDWENPYLTLSPEYEAAQIELFGQMALQGHIYRGRKPVHWSPSSCTALAEAELEYPEGHISKSIYATFRLISVPNSTSMVFKDHFPNIGLAIWTTTPWTIPGNAAVAVNGKLIYAIVEVCPSMKEAEEKPLGTRKRGMLFKSCEHNGMTQYLVVAKDLIATLQKKWGVDLKVKKTFLGSALEHCRYIHPIENRQCPVVIGGDYITTESGTGLVHTAPGHGLEDFSTGLKYSLPVLSPVDDSGKFTEEAGQFAGLDVLDDGNLAVINALDNNLSLLMEENYEHKYPYDWRTKRPTIFRATEQWFASVEGFRQAALEAIKQVTWIPPQGENRITSMTASRADWCISRQRTWGVPIPVFYHIESGELLMNDETIAHIKSIIQQKGSDAWWYMSIEELLPERYHKEKQNYRKGTDTMDVWFDSGSSWAAVVELREGLMWPSDLYLEGSDQHRGWFQSSLLTSIATRGRAPFKNVLTHGFVLDERGRKMSKSLGNVLDPLNVIEGGKNQKEEPGYGADVLRLWVSSVDYTSDVMIGPQILRQMSDIYRKLRGTVRYLLSNLHDWNMAMAIPYEDLPMIDKYALYQLANVIRIIKDGYESYQFYKIFQTMQRFAIVDLSNFYFDVAKDRLYVGGRKSQTRRCCQTVLAEHLHCILRIISPVLPHMAEDAWQHLPFPYSGNDGNVIESVFEARWPKIDEKWMSLATHGVAFWTKILEIRTEVNRVLEMARAGKLIGANLDAKVYLFCSNEQLNSQLHQMSQPGDDADKLKRIFITSQVEILPSVEHTSSVSAAHMGTYSTPSLGDLWIGVARADGNKCERCWNFSVAVGSFSEHPTLCERCYRVINTEAVEGFAAAA